MLMRLKWKLVLIRLEIVLILTQDRCTVCAKCIIGLEIILDVHNGILGDEAEVEACFGPFGGSANLDAT
jgi:hypothetical protein